MRTIRFRGKRMAGGEWVYGYLNEALSPIKVNNDVSNLRIGRSFVRTSTIGQFTSLYDKNGKEIYEGDILALQETDNKVTHCPVSMNCKGYWSIDFGINYGVCLGLVDKKRVEVIGNIHDNHELLKGGEE